MRILFAKRAKELSAERVENVQYDYIKEKAISANVMRGKLLKNRDEIDQMRQTGAIQRHNKKARCSKTVDSQKDTETESSRPST